MANGYEVIEKGTFDGSGVAVDFTLIPATYKHLEISCTTNTNQAGYRAAWMTTINGDTGNNYGYMGVAQGNGYGSPTYDSADSSTAPVWMGNGPGASAGSGSGGDMVGSWNLWFWNYADTTFHKTFYASSGYSSSGAWVMMERGGIWRNTAAINQIKLEVYQSGSDVWASGCQYVLGGWN